MSDIHIFIPSYHRPYNIKTAKYFVKKGWEACKIHVFIDSETDDEEDYKKSTMELGVQLHIFDMEEARNRYDYVHRASPSRRSAGQARNMFQDFAKSNGIDFYCVIDDDTSCYQVRFPVRTRKGVITASGSEIRQTFNAVEDFMRRHKIGLFGLPQCGDHIGGVKPYLYISKVMNTTFYLMPYVYRGERGVQDDDTSLFCGVHNEGYFTGSWGVGLTLLQTQSATQAGGLTDLYNECKLLNKSLVVPIQFPSAVYAEKQKMNGGRLHHHIVYTNLKPCVLKCPNSKRTNINWDAYPEDVPFTNEPIRK